MEWTVATTDRATTLLDRNDHGAVIHAPPAWEDRGGHDVVQQPRPHAERQPVSSTAEAARLAALEPDAAAIASESAAERYGVPLLQEQIEDYHGNTTRFLVLGHRSPAPSGHDKTSLVVSSANRTGLLYRLLEPLSRNGIDMTRIESRPARQQGLWEYVFFIDILGHADDEAVRGALAEMRERASLFRILGAYPRAI